MFGLLGVFFFFFFTVVSLERRVQLDSRISDDSTCSLQLQFMNELIDYDNS